MVKKIQEMQHYAEAGFELAFFGLEVKCSTN